MQVLFSDESHFEVQGQRSQFVRRSDGEPIRPGHIKQYAKHPEKKMFWGCFSAFGPGRLYPVTGMMNSDTYIEVLQTHLIPEMLKVFSNGNGILQQDLATCHTSKKVKKFMVKDNIKTLKWPSNSPDLNKISWIFIVFNFDAINIHNTVYPNFKETCKTPSNLKYLER